MYALAAVASAPHCNSNQGVEPSTVLFCIDSVALPISLKKRKSERQLTAWLLGCALELLNRFLRLRAGAGWGCAHASLSMGEGKNAPVSFSTGAMKLQQAFAATSSEGS